MKYCPECETGFSDSDHFCELDGTRLGSVDPDAPQCEIVFPDSDYFREPDGTQLASVEPDGPELETDFVDSNHSGEPDGTSLVSVEPDVPKSETDFAESDHFCELDGTPLASVESDAPEDETDFLDSDNSCELDGAPFASFYSEAALKSDTNLRMVAFAVTGVVIGVVLFLIYYAMTRELATQSSIAQSSNPSIIVPQPAALLPSAPSPVASASPSVEPSPSPSATPAPSPKTERRVELSSTSISTDQKTKSGPVIIRLNDGARIHSDEAWQTREGIWYRKGSVIALLDPKQVRAIEKVTPAPAPSPAESPAPSPSQTSPRIITATRVQR